MESLAVAETRRRFLAHFTGIGLGSTLVPGALWAQMQQAQTLEATPEMVRAALALSGLDFSEEDEKEIADGLNDTIRNYVEMRSIPATLSWASPPSPESLRRSRAVRKCSAARSRSPRPS